MTPRPREAQPTRAAAAAKDQGTSVGAFDRLFDQYAPRVLGYLLRLTGSRADAEDLTQETFLAAFEGQDKLRTPARPLPWLIGIARRRWRDGRRGSGPVLESLNEETASGTGTNSADPADRIATAATLEAALDRLAVAEREALLLTAVQGLTYAQAARVLNEPVGTVKWRVHQATTQLRRILSAAEERYEERYEAKPSQPAPRNAARADRTPCGR